ncbi:transposase [Acidaminobacter sp.]|uniref:transposase n=1 Tax=Acidaminobacter sp. TaxID=1872102 RepID=UPI00137DEC22|nr:transposase [Acidaminobacter sp.]MDK9712387.1 transposase [Acidaminobacter sp.]MZQ97555.1 hypothetical protein [Acidaminobacter sp.]
MSRKLRNLQQETVYHVVYKGNNGEFLLRHDVDKNMLLETIKRYRLRYDFELYAFCIMDNHVHMLIKMCETSLSKVMQGISQSFTQRYNRKYDRSGHVFDGRYFASPCLTIYSIMKTMAYIHLNPFKAGLSKSLNYLWSSHYAYTRQVGQVWFDSLALMKRLKDCVKSAKETYLQHLEKFKNEPFYFEYHETDVVQEPMTLEVLLTKLKVNRRFKALDHLLSKASEALRTGLKGVHQSKIISEVEVGVNDISTKDSKLVWADGHEHTTQYLKAIILLNQKLKLISNAELARRLRVKRSYIQSFLRRTSKSLPETIMIYDDSLQKEIQSYISFEQTTENGEELHLKNLEKMFFETLQLLQAF